MAHPPAYTHLESLVLLQSLEVEGADTEGFRRVSELLQKHRLIRNSDTYDPARLRPDALRQLFLLLLGEEVNREAGWEDGADDSSSLGSRGKMPGSSPPLSLKDVHKHVDKIPALAERLYAQYRDHMVELIREDERRFLALQREIKAVEQSQKEMQAKAAGQSNMPPMLAPARASHAPCPPPMSTPGAASDIRRGSSPSKPVYPAKPPISTITQQAAAPPSCSPSGAPPGQPPCSTRLADGSVPVLQPPAGLPQTSPRVPQQVVRQNKPAVPPRAEAANKPKDTSGTPQAAALPTAVLKWEEPYQPPSQAGQTPTPGQTQHGGPPNATVLRKGQQPQQQQQQQQGKTPGAVSQPRPLSGKPVLVPPQDTTPLAAPSQPDTPRATAGVAPLQVRPQSTNPIVPPVRPLQPQQAQYQQAPRPTAPSAFPTTPNVAAGPVTAAHKMPQAQPAVQDGQHPSSSTSPAPPASRMDRFYTSPYILQPPRPAIPEHIRQAAGTPSSKHLNLIVAPQTPASAIPVALTRGFGTKWASHSTPSTPRPTMAEPESPAYEPVSPPRRAASNAPETPKTGGIGNRLSRPTPQVGATVPRHHGRLPPNARASGTPSVSQTRRSQSGASHTDELSMDYSSLSTKIKKEALTPRPHDDAGDTTADESVQSRTHVTTPGRLAKRKRTPPEPRALSTQVLWTRGFTKVSSSALDQISSHRHANMFATGVRERDAPNYRQIVLQPQDITSIRAAIKQGNKAAIQAAASLPGGDPGTASVWLPISEDLIPPKGIINSAQLEQELVHIFCNAIMYNPDPDRGPGAAFIKRSQDEEEIVGYHVDENGVVKNTRSMFVEVEKLLGDLRSAEKERGMPLLSATGQATRATPADDTAEDEDELAGDGSTSTTAGVVRRRRVSTRG